MSIMNKYTIETNLSKTEVIKLIKTNTEDADTSGFFSLTRPKKDLPFYGKVEENNFRIHLTHENYALHMFMALEVSVEDEYDTTKIYVKPRGLSPFMKFNLIFTNIVTCGILYFAVTRFNTPVQYIIPALGMFFVLGNGMMLGQSRYYVHKAKRKLQELFTT